MRTNAGTSRSFQWNYLLHFFTTGLYIPFFPVLYSKAGYSDSQVAFLHSLQSICLIVLPPILGYALSRNWFTHRSAISKSILLAFLSAVCIPFCLDEINSLILFTLIHAAVRVCINPVLDAMGLQYCHSTGSEYGRLRLYGSLGFMITCLTGGMFLNISPYLFLGLHAAFHLFQYPIARDLPEPKIHSSNSGTEKPESNLPFAPQFFFFTLTFLMTVSHGAYYVFFSIYLESSCQLDPNLTGSFWLFGVLCETILMRFYVRLFRSSNSVTILALSLGLAGIRWFILASTNHLIIIFVSQALHAFTYGSFHLAAMDWISKYFPKSRQSFAISLYLSFSFGVGGLTGMNLAGFFKEAHGFSGLFQGSAVLALGTLVLVPFLYQSTKKISKKQ